MQNSYSDNSRFAFLFRNTLICAAEERQQSLWKLKSERMCLINEMNELIHPIRTTIVLQNAD
jgi:hypothetical protein